MTYATYNSEGGFLRASNCVSAFVSEIRRLGGEVREMASVVALEFSGDGAKVILEGGEPLHADRVVFAAGAWGSTLYPKLGLHLPLTANRQQVVYVGGLSDEFAPANFPVFLNLDNDLYGFPLDTAGRLKASIHVPGALVDPDVPMTSDDEFTRTIMALLDTYIPRAGKGEVVLARTCMYAMTPDEDFIIDRFPGYDNVALLAAFRDTASSSARS